MEKENIKLIKKNYFFLIEALLVGIPFITSLYAIRQYGSNIYADIALISTVTSQLMFIARFTNIKSMEVLVKKFTKIKAIKMTLILNLIFATIISLIFIGVALYLKGVYSYLVIMIPIFYLTAFQFLRFFALGTEEGNKTSRLFIVALIIANLLRVYFAYKQYPIEIFLTTFIVECVIWAIFMIKKAIEEGILKKCEINKEEWKAMIKIVYPQQIILGLKRILEITIILNIYILLSAEILISYVMARRILGANVTVMYAIDNLIFSIYRKMSDINHAKVLLVTQIGLAIGILMVVELIIVPIIGDRYKHIMAITCVLLPIAFIYIITMGIQKKFIREEKQFFLLKSTTIAMILIYPLCFFIESVWQLIALLYMYEIIEISISKYLNAKNLKNQVHSQPSQDKN